jgi:hypothetical protein
MDNQLIHNMFSASARRQRDIATPSLAYDLPISRWKHVQGYHISPSNSQFLRLKKYLLTSRLGLCMTYSMASITKKMIRGKPYYYARECKRINGKPKIVWQQYLGRPEDIINAMTKAP